MTSRTKLSFSLMAALVLASAALLGCGSSSAPASEGSSSGGGSSGGSGSGSGGSSGGSDAGSDTGSVTQLDGSAPPSDASTKLAPAITCATAAVVGLHWGAITGAGHYGVSRGSTAMGTTVTTAFADTSVAAKTAYSYTVTAYDPTGTAITSAMISATTAAASANGDAPYCPSTVIKSATWNWSTGFNQQNGSDLWPSTWGADGNVYLFFGDGGGFFGSNTNGRASFGIATIHGTKPVVNSGEATNVFGGLDAPHPSTINGKAGSIIAIGSDFYALGGIYGDPGDAPGPSGSPNHYEIVASIGNAYSWKDTSWRFCAADSSGKPTLGTYCATGFVNFGKGNAGAIDAYVYMTAAPVLGWFGTAPPGPANTYMERVLSTQITTQSAYTFYAGLDATGQPLWSSDATKAQPIFTDRNTKPMGIGIVYNAPLNRFIASAQGGVVAQAALYESQYPWGPWATISYANTNPDGTGGWGDLGSDYPSGSGDSLGINFNNAWTSPDGLTMWATFSSDGDAPSTALLPGLASQPMDAFSLVSVTLGQ